MTLERLKSLAIRSSLPTDSDESATLVLGGMECEAVRLKFMKQI